MFDPKLWVVSAWFRAFRFCQLIGWLRTSMNVRAYRCTSCIFAHVVIDSSVSFFCQIHLTSLLLNRIHMPKITFAPWTCSLYFGLIRGSKQACACCWIHYIYMSPWVFQNITSFHTFRLTSIWRAFFFTTSVMQFWDTAWDTIFWSKYCL